MDEKETDAFIRRPILLHTPNRNDKSNSVPTNACNNQNKRGHEKTTLDDIINLIHEKSDKQSDKIDEMSSSLKNEMFNLKAELNENLQSSLQKINKKIDIVEGKADQSLQIAMESQKFCINMMKQSRLENCMDITGLNFNEEETDLKTIALNIIKSFNIQINDNDIKKVTSHEFKKSNNNNITNKILTVMFNEIDTKIRVMHQKNKIKDNRGIFFSITLTPANGYYMRKSKYITKGTNIKPMFYDGAVHVKIREGNIMVIQSEDNLVTLKKCIEETSSNNILNQALANPSSQ